MSTDQIRYTPGKLDLFISTKSFQLGDTGRSVVDGMEVLFDGVNVEIGGARFVLPSLRGAVRSGWLVRADQYDPDALPALPPSANIAVRSANDLGQNPYAPPKKRIITTAVETDERIVMNVGDRARQVSQRTADVRAAMRGGRARQSSLEVGGEEVGIALNRTFRTPAKISSTVTPERVGQYIQEANSVKIQPGAGVSEEELVSQMEEGEREEYLAKKQAYKTEVLNRGRGYSLPTREVTNLAINNQMGTKRAQTTEGISTGTVVVGRGSTDIFDASGSQKAPETSVTSAEGITFKNTNGPKVNPVGVKEEAAPEPATEGSMELPTCSEDIQSRIEKDGTADARRKIALSICTDFPKEYNFGEHWKKRLAMIRLHYEESPNVIRAIFAAESDDFKRVIMTEFPSAFQF